MKYSTNTLPKKTIVATVVSSVLAFGVAAQDWQPVQDKQAAAYGIKTSDTPIDKQAAKEAAKKQSQLPAYYIVQLDDQPIASYRGGIDGLAPTSPVALGTEDINLQSSNAKTYANYLKQQQDKVASELSQRVPGLSVERSLSITFNGLIVSVPKGKSATKALSSVDGVKQVYAHEMYYANMDTSLDVINAPEVWDQLGGQNEAGSGVKVAIIDGGINPDHPMFADNGHERPAGLPGNDYCATIDPTFCNDKLALARYYAPTFTVHPNEFISPRDFGGHGTHVAGTATGNPVSTSYQGVDVNLSGVAPGATVMAYKALFNDPNGQGGGSNIMLIQALEDAVADGADVINNSWGGGAGSDPATSPYLSQFQAAEEAGVLMVTAAGNDGPAARTVGCPSCIEEGLSVASTQHGRTFATFVDAAGIENLEGTPGDGDFEITEAITGPLMPTMRLDESNAEACEAFEEGSLEGHIAFVPRGTCAFTDKANNVQAAGAIGMVLYNNEPGIIIMSMPGATLPSVSVTTEAGNEVLAAYDAMVENEETPMATINAPESVINENAVDAMSSFSSRGPNGDSSFLKPNVAAPGSDILSAYAGAADAYGMIGGTSMASPHVAGAAALLREMYPDYTVHQLKSMLMSSANPNVVKEDLVTPADAFDMGAGRIDVAAAANTGITFDDASVVSNGCVIECQFTRVATNLADTDVEWTATVEFDDPNVSGEVEGGVVAISAPAAEGDEEAAEGAGTAEMHVHIDTSFATPGWKFGRVVLTDPSGTFADAHLPIVVMAGQADDQQIASTMSVTGTPVPGESITMMSHAGDITDVASLPETLVVKIPEGTTLDPASVGVIEENASRIGFSITPNGRTMTWTGTIEDGTPESMINVESFIASGASLNDLEGVEVYGFGADEMETPLDEVTGTLTINGISFGGSMYNAVSISENGFMSMGERSLGNSFFNEPMPGTNWGAQIAPFWSDFEIGGAEFPGSDFLYAVLSDGTDPWLAVEWHKVREWGGTTEYTFSAWLNLNTEEVFFNYVDIPGMPSGFFSGTTIGIQNATGEVGAQYYYDGEGTAVTSGDSLSAYVDMNFGRAALVYDLIPEEVASVEKPEDVIIGYDDTQTFDLSHYEATDIRTKSEVMVTGQTGTTIDDLVEQEYHAVYPFSLAAEGELTVAITQQPANGTLEQVTETVTNDDGEEVEQPVPGHYVYTPNDEYLGEDSFAYVVHDEAGVATSEQVVMITVAEPNDPPAVTSPNGDVNADGEVAVAATTGGSVTLTVEASDADEDELTYSWTQVSGPEVEFEANEAGNAITFAAPSSAANIVFEATVSDGRHDVTQAFNVSVTAPVDTGDDDNNSGGGGSSSSFGFLVGLLALPFAILRRRMAARK